MLGLRSAYRHYKNCDISPSRFKFPTLAPVLRVRGLPRRRSKHTYTACKIKLNSAIQQNTILRRNCKIIVALASSNNVAFSSQRLRSRRTPEEFKISNLIEFRESSDRGDFCRIRYKMIKRVAEALIEFVCGFGVPVMKECVFDC